MPELCRFFGMIITMFYDDHACGIHGSFGHFAPASRREFRRSCQSDQRPSPQQKGASGIV